jgi:hypothetical protein
MMIQPFSKLQQIGQAKRRAARRRFQEGHREALHQSDWSRKSAVFHVPSK